MTLSIRINITYQCAYELWLYDNKVGIKRIIDTEMKNFIITNVGLIGTHKKPNNKHDS